MPALTLLSTSNVVKHWGSDTAFDGKTMLVFFDHNWVKNEMINNLPISLYFKKSTKHDLTSITNSYYNYNSNIDDLIARVPVLSVQALQNIKFNYVVFLQWRNEIYNDDFYSDIIPYCDQKCDTVKKVMLDDVLKLYCKCEYQVENRFERGAEAVSYFISLRPRKEEIEVANNYYARNGGESDRGRQSENSLNNCITKSCLQTMNHARDLAIGGISVAIFFLITNILMSFIGNLTFKNVYRVALSLRDNHKGKQRAVVS